MLLLMSDLLDGRRMTAGMRTRRDVRESWIMGLRGFRYSLLHCDAGLFIGKMSISRDRPGWGSFVTVRHIDYLELSDRGVDVSDVYRRSGRPYM